eukprot:EG_transcript_12490
MHMDVEAHHKCDATDGLPREVGLAWFEAARYGNLATAKRLLKAYPRLLGYHGRGTSYGFVGNAALHWAVSRGDLPMSRWLLDRGADVNVQNHGGSTPLHTACAHGQAPLVAFLLQQGANPDLVDCCQDCPADVVPPAAAGRITPLLRGYALLQTMAAEPPGGWRVADMREVLRLAGQGGERFVERCEMQAAVQQLLEQFRAVQTQGNTTPEPAVPAADDAASPNTTAASAAELDAAAEAKLRGNEAFKAGDYKTAIRLYTMAIKFVPTDAVFHSNRAACHLALGQPHRALADATEAARLQPSWPKAHHRLGTALHQLGRYHEAVAAFQAGLALKPDDASLQTALRDATAAMARDGGPDSDSEEEGRPAPKVVPLAQRKPWFDCVVCDNKTRDHAATPCCARQLCGTCLRRAKGCPFRCTDSTDSG